MRDEQGHRRSARGRGRIEGEDAWVARLELNARPLGFGPGGEIDLHVSTDRNESLASVAVGGYGNMRGLAEGACWIAGLSAAGSTTSSTTASPIMAAT